MPDDDSVPVDAAPVPSQVHAWCVVALAALCDPNRDFALPLGDPVRTAQRKLFALLLAHPDANALSVSRPSVPSTVRVRGSTGNELQATDNDETNTPSPLFGLPALVRDCNVDLDLPQEPTPPVMARHGRELRDYQRASLRWLLDKEREAVMGALTWPWDWRASCGTAEASQTGRSIGTAT